MTRQLSLRDFLTRAEAAHLAVAIRAYRKSRPFGVPHTFADLESELARAAGVSAADSDRHGPPAPATTQELADAEPVDVFTIDQVAKRLQQSRRTIERWIAIGDLPVVRLGRSVRIQREALDAFVAQGST